MRRLSACVPSRPRGARKLHDLDVEDTSTPRLKISCRPKVDLKAGPCSDLHCRRIGGLRPLSRPTVLAGKVNHYLKLKSKPSLNLT